MKLELLMNLTPHVAQMQSSWFNKGKENNDTRTATSELKVEMLDSNIFDQGHKDHVTRSYTGTSFLVFTRSLCPTIYFVGERFLHKMNTFPSNMKVLV